MMITRKLFTLDFVYSSRHVLGPLNKKLIFRIFFIFSHDSFHYFTSTRIFLVESEQKSKIANHQREALLIWVKFIADCDISLVWLVHLYILVQFKVLTAHLTRSSRLTLSISFVHTSERNTIISATQHRKIKTHIADISLQWAFRSNTSTQQQTWTLSYMLRWNEIHFSLSTNQQHTAKARGGYFHFRSTQRQSMMWWGEEGEMCWTHHKCWCVRCGRLVWSSIMKHVQLLQLWIQISTALFSQVNKHRQDCELFSLLVAFFHDQQ